MKPFASSSGHRRVVLPVWLCVVLGLLCGCGPVRQTHTIPASCTEATLDKSLLTGEPCAPPCWHNLMPGESTAEDVRRELEHSPWVKADTITVAEAEIRGVPVVYFGWEDCGTTGPYSKEYRGNLYNRVFLREGRVLRIQIGLDYPLTLGEVVAEYGPPASVHASIGGIESFGYELSAEYPALGLFFFSFTYPVDPDEVTIEDGIGILDEGLVMTSVTYYVPRPTLEAVLSETFLLSAEGVAEVMTDEREWTGFGQVMLAEHPRWR